MERKGHERFVEFRNVRKVYQTGEVSIKTLHDVILTIIHAEAVYERT